MYRVLCWDDEVLVGFMKKRREVIGRVMEGERVVFMGGGVEEVDGGWEEGVCDT